MVVSLREIGARIRAIRMQRELTQQKLAKILGVHQTNVSEMERGARSFTVRQLVKLSRALHVSPNEIVGESSTSTPTLRSGRILRRVQRIGELPKAEQQAVLKILDRVLQAHEAERGHGGAAAP
jgi:transcriptional regulator with XRE-family HTH domain